MPLSTNVPKIVLLIAFGMLLGLINLVVCPMHAFAQSQPLPEEIAAPEPAVKIPKRDWTRLAAETYFAGGTVVDMRTTVSGLDRPTDAYSTSGQFLMQYSLRERDWASHIGIHSAGGVTSANVLLNVGVDLLSQRLYRGGHRRVAVLLLVAKATGNWYDGINNARILGNVDKAVRLQTGYQGAVIWR